MPTCDFFSHAECSPFEYGNPTNGRVEGNGRVYRSTYRFICNHGYVLFGHDTITCIENGTWNGTSPRCLKGNKLWQRGLSKLYNDFGEILLSLSWFQNIFVYSIGNLLLIYSQLTQKDEKPVSMSHDIANNRTSCKRPTKFICHLRE